MAREPGGGIGDRRPCVDRVDRDLDDDDAVGGVEHRQRIADRAAAFARVGPGDHDGFEGRGGCALGNDQHRATRAQDQLAGIGMRREVGKTGTGAGDNEVGRPRILGHDVRDVGERRDRAPFERMPREPFVRVELGLGTGQFAGDDVALDHRIFTAEIAVARADLDRLARGDADHRGVVSVGERGRDVEQRNVGTPAIEMHHQGRIGHARSPSFADLSAFGRGRESIGNYAGAPRVAGMCVVPDAVGDRPHR